MDASDTMGAAPVIVVCGMAFEAAIVAGSGILTLCGIGSPALAARLDALVARAVPSCRGILSFGTAAGLDPALASGACVIAEAVVCDGMRFEVDGAWLRALHERLPSASAGVLAGVDAPLVDARGKARLRATSGACIADMESHHAAGVAARHGLPFAACRVVVDGARRGLPPAAMAGLREDGSTALMPLLHSLVAQPGQLYALLRLACDALVARRSLCAARLRLGRDLSLTG